MITIMIGQTETGWIELRATQLCREEALRTFYEEGGSENSDLRQFFWKYTFNIQYSSTENNSNAGQGLEEQQKCTWHYILLSLQLPPEVLGK
ncbi:hypothetical protein SOVF_139220 [Spinacia oleracea]|nr:hypothetical protein SOVF_139220 [Spinacia oleracea]